MTRLPALEYMLAMYRPGRPEFSKSPKMAPMVPKSPGPSTISCLRKVPSPLFNRSKPAPNSLGTYRSGQPSPLASSHSAVNVERNSPSVPLAAVTSSNCQLPLFLKSWLPRALPLLPSIQEAPLGTPGRVT